NNMTESLDRWRAKFGKDPGNEDDYVKSFYQTAQLYHAKGRTPQAKAAEQATIDAWKARGSVKNSAGAKMAAEFALDDAENFYTKTWEPFAITKPASSTVLKVAKTQIEGQTKQINDLRKKVEDKYIDLDQYGVLDASMAANVRFGDIQYD